MGLQLIVFAKAPEPGKVKTRLIPTLGADGAADLASHLLQRTLDEARDAAIALSQDIQGPVHVHVCGSPDPEHPSWSGMVLPLNCHRSAQIEGDLGVRMAHAFTQALGCGEDVLLFGTDGIGLDWRRIVQAGQALMQHDAVLQPVLDGGYLLLGLRSHVVNDVAVLFEAMPWSTDRVAALTLERLEALGHATLQLPDLRDVDGPDDLDYLVVSRRKEPQAERR